MASNEKACEENNDSFVLIKTRRGKDEFPRSRMSCEDRNKFRRIERLRARGGIFLGSFWTNDSVTKKGCFEVRIEIDGETKPFKIDHPFHTDNIQSPKARNPHVKE